jgi:hypothetical protein
MIGANDKAFTIPHVERSLPVSAEAIVALGEPARMPR